MRNWIVPSAVVLSCSMAMAAQDVRGSASGRITDTKGNGLSEVSVTITDTQTGVQHHGVSHSDGRYEMPFLNPGTYNIVAEKTGFAHVEQTGLIISTATDTRLDISMPVATVTTDVVVTAKPNTKTCKILLIGAGTFVDCMLRPFQFRNSAALRGAAIGSILLSRRR